MTKPQALDLLMLLSALESWAFSTGKQLPESCPCCGEAMRVYSRCLNAGCEAVMTTPEQSRYNKVRALMKTCATRLDEPPTPSVPEGWKLVPIEPTPKTEGVTE